MVHPVSTQTLQEMKTYYQERAHEYDEWFYRQGRYALGPTANASWFAEANEVFAVLDDFNLTGEALELAPGTGIWTERLVRTASTVTAVDASPEMIEINRAKVSSNRVTYVLADLFSWRPERVYDAVLFCFWISHVPLERLDSFLSSVAAMLRPGGKVFFVDGQRNSNGSAAHQQTPIQDSQLTRRTLNDGRAFEIIKNYYDPSDLAARCTRAGFDITVHETATHFLYGYGTRMG
ncbi:MAG TPA: class I SAM-dependent methyltransferase [Ktedonobacteraceae bacterium]|nr:class I SAM-dependent methyltransferase [Ktedonobacteraceae bacterium]